MASDVPEPFDVSAQDRLRAELVDAGFDPIAGPRRWRGPVPKGLSILGAADCLEIQLQDGYPIFPPKVFAPGVDTEHVSAAAEVCLWRPGDQSGAWESLDGIVQRLREFDNRAAQGFAEKDLMLDAHLNFSSIHHLMAILELDPLAPAPAPGIELDVLDLRAAETDNRLLEIQIGAPSSSHPIGGKAYRLRTTVNPPPRDLDGVREALGSGHLKNLERLISRVARDGNDRFVVLTWQTSAGPNVLVVLLQRPRDTVIARALEAAPTDRRYLGARAGPDFSALQDLKAIVFGTGAIGGYAARSLATSGLGALLLVDPDTVRPSNAPRLATGRFGIGHNKARVSAVEIKSVAPWTEVTTETRRITTPSSLRNAVKGADVVIDATGDESVTRALELVSAQMSISLVTAALYRGGALTRVRRVRPGQDPALDARTDPEVFPVIPRGQEPEGREPGCGAPVNNASPVACLAAAALLADVAIDTVLATKRHTAEAIEVYRAIEPPFDAVGRRAA